MKIKSPFNKAYALFLIISLYPFFAFSQLDSSIETPPVENLTTIFQELHDFDKLVITTNLDSLVQNKREGLWQMAKLQAFKDDKEGLNLKIQLRPRGKFRRMKCDLPPLKINFAKGDLDSLGLNKTFDKFKLVTHCLNNSEGEQIVMKEYWIYKMYEQVTEESYKTHLLEVTYVDENDALRTMNGRAFIIEPNEEMAHRIGGTVVDSLGVLPNQVAPTSYHNVLLFNYMIGNTDWKLHLQKNLRLVKKENSALFTLVPYDFDLSKIVNPPYMVMYPDAKKTDLNNRYAKGTFVDRDALISQIEKFQELKNTGFKCFESCDVLSKKEKNQMKYYLSSFYKILKKEKQLIKVFLDTKI